MFVVSTQRPRALVDGRTPLLQGPSSNRLGVQGHELNASALLSSASSSMERGAPEYSQSGLLTPHPSNFGDNHSEASSADHAPAAQYATQEVRSSNYSTTATPTSDYSAYPQSARSGSFPEHVQQRPYHPATNPGAGGGSGGGMARPPTSPSVPDQDGRDHQDDQQVKSDSDTPLDHPVAAPSPSYPHNQFAPYAPPQDMPHPYPPHSGPMYAQPRPNWTDYAGGQPSPLTPGHNHHVFPQTPTSTSAPSRQSQVSERGIAAAW